MKHDISLLDDYPELASHPDDMTYPDGWEFSDEWGAMSFEERLGLLHDAHVLNQMNCGTDKEAWCFLELLLMMAGE